MTQTLALTHFLCANLYPFSVQAGGHASLKTLHLKTVRAKIVKLISQDCDSANADASASAQMSDRNQMLHYDLIAQTIWHSPLEWLSAEWRTPGSS